MSSMKDPDFLRTFFRELQSEPLEPGDEHYVPLYEDPDLVDVDPVDPLARGIEWTPGESVQLLSGFRGTGKSTELRRLRKRLQDAGFLVALIDIEDHLNLTTEVDVSDFLMALAGAFGRALAAPALLDDDGLEEGYWERIRAFLSGAEVASTTLDTRVPGVHLKVALKSDPTFKKRLQQQMAGHLTALVEEVRGFLRDAVEDLKKKHGSKVETVLLVDSMEHIRGTSANAEEVHKSVEALFASHADKLRLPALHVVYTVPPFLKVRYANLGALYGPGGLHTLPAVKLRESETEDGNGDHHWQPGYDALERVIHKRGDWSRLLRSRQRLHRLIELSGGQLRDLLRLVAEVIRRSDKLPVSDRAFEAAIHQIRNEFLPVSDLDAVRLAHVSETHRAPLGSKAELADFAHYLDTHMVLCYRNGHEWYDVHPLIREIVIEQAKSVRDEE
ncbi:MAG: hypothetical protein AAF725_20840 [Acidobacteriota bacterium]